MTRFVRFVLAWITTMVALPLVVRAWHDSGPPPIHTALFLVCCCAVGPILDKVLWRSR